MASNGISFGRSHNLQHFGSPDASSSRRRVVAMSSTPKSNEHGCINGTAQAPLPVTLPPNVNHGPIGPTSPFESMFMPGADANANATANATRPLSTASNLHQQSRTSTACPTTASIPNRQLSGNASAFQPHSGQATNMYSLNYGSRPDVDENALSASPRTDQRTLSAIAEASQDENGSCPRTSGKSRDRGDQEVIGSRTLPPSPVEPVFFTTDTGPKVPFVGGHYIQIDNIHPGEYDHCLDRLNRERQWNTRLLGVRTVPSVTPKKHLTIVCCFDSVDDAAEAEDDVSMINPSWSVGYVSHGVYSSSKDNGRAYDAALYDGQVIFTATNQGDSRSKPEPGNIFSKTRSIVQYFGGLVAFRHEGAAGNVLIFHVEYRKITDANDALHRVGSQPGFYTDANQKYWRIEIRPLEYDEPESLRAAAEPHMMISSPQESMPAPGQTMTSRTGRTAWKLNEKGEEQPVQAHLVLDKISPGVRHQSAPSPHTPTFFAGRAVGNTVRGESWSGPFGSSNVGCNSNERRYNKDDEPNSVNIDRITKGHDVRTTVMLRNLPNQWDVHKFKAILDRTNHGRYDFSYLRIDFENNTNVGYAFVNFLSAAEILTFHHEFHDREWEPGSYGKKKAAMSYATVQGYDCLVEKFRNSSIMDEFTGYRPKLWWTVLSASDNPELIGTERAFPPPNNPSKKQRSQDNAGSVGLFAPRSGQRSGDRRGRSLFDRGTSQQIHEDSALATASPTPGNYGYFHPGTIAPPPAFPQMPMMYPSPFGHFYPAPGHGDPFHQPAYHSVQMQPMYWQSSRPFRAGGMSTWQIQAPATVQTPSGAPAPVNVAAPAGIPGPPGTKYTPVNGASMLRTISQGSLHVRPRCFTNEDLVRANGNGAVVVNGSVPRAMAREGYQGDEAQDLSPESPPVPTQPREKSRHLSHSIHRPA